MENLFGDIHTSLRSLRKRPGLTSVVILTAALAIGACTALFDLANLVAWMPIPGTEPDRLVRVYTEHPQPFIGLWGGVPSHDHDEYTRNATSFDGLTGERWGTLEIAPTSDTDRFPKRPVAARFVSGNYFQVLGAGIARGRSLVPADDHPEAGAVAVLSSRFFRIHFAENEQILGNTVLLNDEPVLIVGVADPRFEALVAGGSESDLWVPDALGPRLVTSYNEAPLVPSTDTLGRLRRGVSNVQAQAELQNLATELDRLHPLPTIKRKVTVVPARFSAGIDRRNFRPILLLFAAAAALLMTLACANIANMLLGRSLERAREIATRLALGASRTRLIRLLLTESLVLACAAGVLGVVFAVASRRLFALWELEALAREMRLDHRVLAASFAACLCAAVLFGLFPAFAATRTNLVGALKDGAGSARRSTLRAFQSLAAVQIALATVLLICTGAIASNLWSLSKTDLGFDDAGLVQGTILFGTFGYDKQEARRFMVDLEERVAALPMVSSTSRSLFVPPVYFDVERSFRRPDDPETQRSARFNLIDDGYFETLGLPLIAGRSFNSTETNGQESIIVNEMLARQVWPESAPADCVGRTLLITQRRPTDPNPEHRIIGISETVKQHDLKSAGEPVLYLPIDQRGTASLSLLARIDGDPELYAAALRNEIERLDPNLQAHSITTSAEHRWSALIVYRMQAQSMILLAAVGLLLSLLGVFGVLQLTVTRQRREIGIRIAVGADRQRIASWVLRKTAILATAGVSVGLLASLGAVRVLGSWVEDLGSTPPWIYLAVSTLLFTSAVIATLAPTLRASRVAPSETLRSE